MLINPIIAAAATVAARAVGTILPRDWTANGKRSSSNQHYRPEPSFREAFPANEYFMDMEEDYMHEQAREFEEFMMANSANNAHNVAHHSILADNKPPIDAEILSKEQTETPPTKTKPPPPPLPNTNDPLILLGSNPGDSFDDIRAAYKRMVKIYHPDILMGPDASADERQAANWNFARINAAFDILKRKEDEEVLEYTVYVDGQRVTRSVVVSEEEAEFRRRGDPTYIDYNRIVEMAEYRKHHPQERMWYENEHDYQTRYNSNFEVGESNNYDSYSRGKWWTGRRAFEHDHGFEHIPSNEKMWGERGMFSQEETGNNHRSSGHHGSVGGGYGVNPTQNQWWNENHHATFDDDYDQAPPPNNNYGYHHPLPRNSQRFDAETSKRGYHKDRRWDEGPTFDEARYDPPSHHNDGNTNAFDYDPQEYFPSKEKWWQVDDPNMGEFGP
mmetsp:Transcript_10208/g.21520  ORF Transcript_10208/g.21520 Transcript_10208/m.21520 type:complete len:444 (-) Transcript_10208:332-1663(-)